MLWQVGGVVNSVVELGSSSVGLVVYRREEGGRNSKYNANISMTMRDMTMSGARCVLTVGWLVRHMPKDGLSLWEPIKRRRCLETG